MLSCDLQPIRWLKKPRDIVLSMSKIMSKNVSLIPRPPSFLPSFYVHSNTWERKTGEKQGRPGSFHHMNDIWWMRGGRRGEGPILNLKTKVKTRSFDHAKVWSPKLG